MKRRILTFTIILVILFLAAACQPATSPGGSSEEPYPGPEGDNPVESGSEVVQPYPEPGVDTPVELKPFVISTDHEFAPAVGDAALKEGNVFIHSSDILMLESFPVQVRLQLSGDLPTPCHALRVVISPPDAGNQIQIAVYSVSDPEMMCTQVLSPFDATIPIGDFTSGSYRVFINGESIGMIDLP